MYYLSDFIVGEFDRLGCFALYALLRHYCIIAALLLRHCHVTTAPLLRHCYVGCAFSTLPWLSFGSIFTFSSTRLGAIETRRFRRFFFVAPYAISASFLRCCWSTEWRNGTVTFVDSSSWISGELGSGFDRHIYISVLASHGGISLTLYIVTKPTDSSNSYQNYLSSAVTIYIALLPSPAPPFWVLAWSF